MERARRKPVQIDPTRYQPSVISESLEFAKANITESVISDPKRVNETEATATYLVDKFHHPDGKKFYYKVAWRLDRNVIDRLVALAFDKGNSPARYFSVCAKREMGQ